MILQSTHKINSNMNLERVLSLKEKNQLAFALVLSSTCENQDYSGEGTA